MKKLFISFCVVISFSVLFGFQGAQHKIIDIENSNTIRVNIGKQAKIKNGDIFQVFGKSQIVHPATGELIERENVYIGKIKINKVLATESLAKILEQNKYFNVGDKVVKVATNADRIELIEFTENEFESPNNREYNKTIYEKAKEPVRSIKAKKLWVDGPFILEKSDFLLSFVEKMEIIVLDDDSYYDDYNGVDFFCHLNFKYGIWENIQAGFDIPFLFRSFGYSVEEIRFEGDGMGLSDLKFFAMYSATLESNESIYYSFGTEMSIPTDNGWTERTEGSSIINFELSTSTGYKTLSLISNIGKKTKKMYTYAEFIYNINGTREEYSYEYDGRTITLPEFDPKNSWDLNFVGSFFTSEKNKIGFKLNCHRYDGLNEIYFMPSISHAFSKYISDFGFSLPLKTDYDTKTYNWNVGLSW